MPVLDLPNVEQNRSRHGRIRFYYRVHGKRLARLPDDPNTKEFAEAYWAVHDPQAPKPKKIVTVTSGTMGYLCKQYTTSEAWKKLDPKTQRVRQLMIEEILREPLTLEADDKRTFRELPIEAMTLANLTVLRDRKKEFPFAGDNRVKVLRQIMATPKPDGKALYCAENTALLLKKFNKQTEGFHTVRDHELKQYIDFHGGVSKAVLALGLLMYTGVRVSDLRAIGPKHRQGGALTFQVYKGRQSHPKQLTIEIHPALEVLLQRHPTKGPTFLATEFGKPFSIKGMSNKVSDWFTEAGLAHCSAHSVRKGLATSLAESEATDKMLDHMFGWSGGKTSQLYTKKVEQARVARQAVAKIKWDSFEDLLPHPDLDGSSNCHTSKKMLENSVC